MKTPYEAPIVTKVRLEITNAVLGACHSSANITPKVGTIACSTTAGCYNPPLPAGRAPVGQSIGNQFQP